MKSFRYDQQIKRELKGIHACGCRCNERLKVKTDGSTRLRDTGFLRQCVYYNGENERGIHTCGCRCNERLKVKTDGSAESK